MKAVWRPMHRDDLAAVEAIADIVHPAYPERPQVPAERLQLFPDGCFVLQGETPLGYMVSHPWIYGRPPALDSLLGALPEKPDTYYLHDIALLPEARGTGAATAAVGLLVTAARAALCANITLIAVNGSVPFWQRQGFEIVDVPELGAKLSTYDKDACFMRRTL